MGKLDHGTLSFPSNIGEIRVTIEYEAYQGFITPTRCVIDGKGASLLDDANYFSREHLNLWQRAAEADYRRRTFAPDPSDCFEQPGRSAARALAAYSPPSYFDRVDARARWGA